MDAEGLKRVIASNPNVRHKMTLEEAQKLETFFERGFIVTARTLCHNGFSIFSEQIVERKSGYWCKVGAIECDIREFDPIQITVYQKLEDWLYW